jgi:adenine-specific DNA-methyltransferase
MANDRIKKLELTWTGKDAQISPEPRILIEDKKKSYGDKDSENMLIHGDNLLALKSLEADFAGKVKCIYIDPPYNTGNAFEHYDDGLEHSIWLSLMRDRLEILKNLLSDDGSIWITLDDNEAHYTKMMCDEIFDRKNFIADVIWNSRKSVSNDAIISLNTNHILIFAKNIDIIRAKAKRSELFKGAANTEKFSNPDNDPRGPWVADPMDAPNIRENLSYPIVNPSTGKQHLPPGGRCWRISREKFASALAENRVVWGKSGTSKPQLKRYLSDAENKGQVMTTLWTDLDTTTNATKHSMELFGDNPFTNPKPENLIERVLMLASKENDLVLDSFLGSGTTAAVAHKMGRRWIGVELGDHAYTHCIPRLQKVIDGSDQGGISKAVDWKGGGGFKFYELASSLVVKDARGFDIISKEYNGDMLAEAMCKIMGFKYRPDKAVFWKQGKGTEKNWLFTTTMTLTEDYLEEIHNELGGESLLICCGGFVGNKAAFKNITIKKIPKEILKKCEWNQPGYPLPVKEDFTAKDFEIEGE